ncbi:signal peptidase I, partial [Candidatus Thorarchaeota archaeon]
ESESMLPTLDVGHLLVLQARAPEQIQVGDIIVFNAHYHDKPIVHRIVEIENATVVVDNVTIYELHYFTQGDNNDLRDPMYRVYEDIIGVVVLAIPYVGHITLFLHEPYGLAIVMILFVALLILPEFFMKDDDKDEEEPTESEEQGTTNA